MNTLHALAITIAGFCISFSSQGQTTPDSLSHPKESQSFITEGGWFKYLSLPERYGLGFQAAYVFWLSKNVTLGPGVGYIDAGNGSISVHGDFRAWLSTDKNKPYFGLSPGYLFHEEGGGSIFVQPSFGTLLDLSKTGLMFSVGCIILADDSAFEDDLEFSTILGIRIGVIF